MTSWLDTIYNEDMLTGLARVPDGSVDLVMMDPPYEMGSEGGGAFGSAKRSYHGEIAPLTDGVTEEMLDAIMRKMRSVNIYIWCNKAQIWQYMEYFHRKHPEASMDILTWHKTNPTPTCNNKYLSDTEYVLFFRGKGVKLHGTYATKAKYRVTSVNTADKKAYGHPTVKPLAFVRDMIGNSAVAADGHVPVVLDPFMGSGTTAVAAVQLGLHYVGFELDRGYWETAQRRIAEARA